MKPSASITGDVEAWKESEVEFGRFPALWNSVWLSVFVVLVGFGLFLGFVLYFAVPSTWRTVVALS